MITPLLLSVFAYATIADEVALKQTNWAALCAGGVCQAQASDDWLQIRVTRTRDGTTFELTPLACARPSGAVGAALDAFTLRPEGTSYARAASRLAKRMAKLQDKYLDRCGRPYRQPSALYDERDLSLFLINTDRFVTGGSV